MLEVVLIELQRMEKTFAEGQMTLTEKASSTITWKELTDQFDWGIFDLRT